MRRRKRTEAPTGFEEWGGYMAMKKAKLQEQFCESASKQGNQKNNLFEGISIFVNGYTDPTADELKNLMMQYGGVYHHYYRTGRTTYVIASNLPDSKLKQTQGIKFVKPSWIVDCIKENRIIDYRDYLLYTNQSKTQPGLKYFSEKNSDLNISKQTVTKTATDQEFLSEFYNNSRLHHISTMGAVFKQYVNDLRSNENHKFSGRDQLLNREKKLQEFKDELYEDDSVAPVGSKTIMHIDMDCFFVSVGIRDRPDLKGIPVAVAHAKGNRSHPREGMKKEIELYNQKYGRKVSNADNPSSSHWTESMDALDSMSEIASCSYEARAAGVKNGMFLGQALKLCPNLKPIHYDFEAYKEVSYTLYDTVARYTLDIEAVSCDEMFVDCSSLLSSASITPLEFAKILRDEIKSKTRCPCSVGFGANRLQARIATKKAKPDGQFHLDSNPEEFFRSIPVSDLPGVGYSTTYKFKSQGVQTCGDVQKIPLKKLQSDFGYKLGDTLFKHCRGIDDKELVFHQVRKSVSAEVNYGIRFQNDSERDVFLEQLSKEVSDRVKGIKMKGKSITLKLMVRSKDAPQETAKFLGHGVCDHITKSSTLANAVSDPNIIYREVLKIINKLKIESKELRGIGIQLTRLESSSDISDNGLLKFLNKPKKKSINTETVKETSDILLSVPSTSKEAISGHKEALSRRSSTDSLLNLTLSKVDQSFLSAVPGDIKVEIMNYLTENSKSKRNSPSFSENENAFMSIDEIEEETPFEDPDAVKSYVSPGELKNLLKEWIENEQHPMDRDIKFVNNYLQELVHKGYLEELAIILKYFNTFIKRFCRADEWKSAYSTVLRDVQSEMIEKFKGKLALEDEYTHF